MWLVSDDLLLKLRPQVLQENGLTPVCVAMWTEKPPLCLKRLPQTGQQYGFSPVWILE